MTWWWVLLVAAVCLRRPAILWAQRWDFRRRVRSTPTHLVIEKTPAPLSRFGPPPTDPRCKYCDRPATHQSKVDDGWRCGTCIPCWCAWCRGRVGVHGEDAVALHRATIDSIARKHGG